MCALCACVLLHSRTSAHSHLAAIALPTPVPSHTGSRRPTAPCVPRCTISAFCVVPHCLLPCTALHCTVCALLHCGCGQRAVGSGSPATHCHTAWRLWAVELLQCTVSLPWGSGQCNSCNARPLCLGAVGSGTRAIHCLTARGQWVVELLLHTASLPGGSGQWSSRSFCHALPHCLGAVGSGTPAMHRHSARRQCAVQLLRYTASLPGGSGQCNSCNALPHCLGAVGSGTPAGVVWCGALRCVALRCVALRSLLMSCNSDPQCAFVQCYALHRNRQPPPPPPGRAPTTVQKSQDIRTSRSGTLGCRTLSGPQTRHHE